MLKLLKPTFILQVENHYAAAVALSLRHLSRGLATVDSPKMQLICNHLKLTLHYKLLITSQVMKCSTLQCSGSTRAVL